MQYHGLVDVAVYTEFNAASATAAVAAAAAAAAAVMVSGGLTFLCMADEVCYILFVKANSLPIHC
jgi:hypothetical protein